MEALPGDAIRFELPPALAAAPPETPPRASACRSSTRWPPCTPTEPAAVGLGDLRPARRLRPAPDQALARPVGPRPRPTCPRPGLGRRLAGARTSRPSRLGCASCTATTAWTTSSSRRRRRRACSASSTGSLRRSATRWPTSAGCWRSGASRPTIRPDLPILPRVMEQPGFPSRAELAARYAEQTGRPLPDLTYYVVFAMWRMAVLLEGHWATPRPRHRRRLRLRLPGDGRPGLRRPLRRLAESVRSHRRPEDRAARDSSIRAGERLVMVALGGG